MEEQKTALQEPESNQTELATQEIIVNPPETKKKKKIIMAGCISALAVILAVVLVVTYTNSPIRRFDSALNDDDNMTAKALYSTNADNEKFANKAQAVVEEYIQKNVNAYCEGEIEYMDHFRSPDRVSAARADIFSAVGWFWSYRGHSSAAVSASTGDRDSVVVVPGNQNIGQSGFQNEVQQVIAGMGDSPAIFGVVFYNQAMGFSNGFEALIVVQVSSAGIFDSVDTAVIMTALMQKCCYDKLNGTPDSSSTDVYFKAIACNGYPSVRSSREMSVGFGCTLDGNGWSYKFTFEIMLIQQVKNLVQIPCYTVIAGQLFHRSTPLQKNGDRATMNTVPMWDLIGSLASCFGRL